MPRFTRSRNQRRLSPHIVMRGLCLLACLGMGPLHAQDWLSGSPWSGLGGFAPLSTPIPGTGLAMPMAPSAQTPWSGLASPLTPSTPPSFPYTALPYTYGSGYLDRLPGWGDSYATARQPPYAGRALSCPDSSAAGSFQPDLSGIWRGSGGETVEIERNRARIWGWGDKPCNCVFFLVGRRMIAYSPDSDRVRKYWYQGGGNQFTLIDEAGNLLTFQRAR